MNETSPRPTDRLSRGYLLGLVTLTGAAVLALEVLGTRVIGTYYGSSLYVWAALLSVTMVCLAGGYALGGRLADRVPSVRVLCLLVMWAGAGILPVPFLARVLEPFDRWLGLEWGAMASAFVIFAVPLTLLAMAGPYVIRLRARRVEGVGSTSGAVYALSTVGSVAGVLVASLWMIPTLGTRTALHIWSGLLIAWGALGLVWRTRSDWAPLFTLAAVSVAVALGRERRFEGELFHTESAYGDLRVIEREVPGRGLYRMLLVNGIMQTGMPLDIDLVGRGALLKSEDYYLELLPYFHADLGAGRRGVLIGLAGGMFPRVMEFYDIEWTAVEIDVKVAELAQAYFGYRGEITYTDGSVHAVDLGAFPNRASPAAAHGEETGHDHLPAGPYRGRAVIQDGRQFLRRNAGPFDFVVLDAYTSDVIPFHLITREFFELVRSRLTSDGIFAMNYIGRPRGDFVTDSLFRTLGAVFGADLVEAYRTGSDEDAVQVMLVLAFRRPMTLLPLWRSGAFEGGVDQLSRDLAQRRAHTEAPGGAIITDDFNPIDLARAATAIEWRRQTMTFLRTGP